MRGGLILVDVGGDSGGAILSHTLLNSPATYLRAGPETKVNASGTLSLRTLGGKKISIHTRHPKSGSQVTESE